MGFWSEHIGLLPELAQSALEGSLEVPLFIILFYLFKKIFFVLLGPHQRYMEVPRLGVQSEL